MILLRMNRVKEEVCNKIIDKKINNNHFFNLLNRKDF